MSLLGDRQILGIVEYQRAVLVCLKVRFRKHNNAALGNITAVDCYLPFLLFHNYIYILYILNIVLIDLCYKCNIVSGFKLES